MFRLQIQERTARVIHITDAIYKLTAKAVVGAVHKDLFWRTEAQIPTDAGVLRLTVDALNDRKGKCLACALISAAVGADENLTTDIDTNYLKKLINHSLYCKRALPTITILHTLI